MAEETLAVRNDCNEARPKKESVKDASIGFTKPVIICDSSEVSKTNDTTYRPNNIVVELLKRDSRRYGKVTFAKLAPEQTIREVLCSRFPILKKKTFFFASADQYGRLNFRDSEEWSGRNLRRWLPGSSAMYLILEVATNPEEPLIQEQQGSTEDNSPSSGLSLTTMRTDISNEALMSRNSSRSQRALLDFLSSPEKIKLDDIKRRKVSCSLPKSSSSHSPTDPTCLKTEKSDPDPENENPPPKRKRKHVTNGNVSLESFASSEVDCLQHAKRRARSSRTTEPFYSVEDNTSQDRGGREDEYSLHVKLIASRTMDLSPEQLSRVKCKTRTGPSLISRQKRPDISKKRESISRHSGTEVGVCHKVLDARRQEPRAKPCVIKWLSRLPDSSTTSPAPHECHAQNCYSSDRNIDSLPRRETRLHFADNSSSMACDDKPSHSADANNNAHMVTGCCLSAPNLESGSTLDYPNDSNSSHRAEFKARRQKDESNDEEEKRLEGKNNEDKTNPLDFPPCLVPCFMISNPLYASQFYRSMPTVTSSTPICAPSTQALSWKRGTVFTRPCEGNLAFHPLGLPSPFSGRTPCGFGRGNLATTSGNEDESNARDQHCHEKTDSFNVDSEEKTERSSLLQKYIRSTHEKLSSTVKQESTEDLWSKFPCEIIPSKGSCKGGDVFVIVFEQSLHQEINETRLSVKFGKTEIDELIYVNPFTIKGVVPESGLPGSVSVTIVTCDGELVGSTEFNYIDDFIEGLNKAMLDNRHGKALLDFATSSLEQEHNKLQGKMREITELLVYLASQDSSREKALNSVMGNQDKCRPPINLSYHNHVTHDDSHVDRENETNRLGKEDQNIDYQCGSKTILHEEDPKEADNLLLLSSIASSIKHSPPWSSQSAGSSPLSTTESITPPLSLSLTKTSNQCDSPGFDKKVFVLPPNSRYLPSQSELCKLRSSGSFYSKVHFNSTMNEDDVVKEIKKTFLELKDSRLRLAMVDQTGKLVYHDEIWTGNTIRRKLRGNSVLYVAPIS